MENLQKIYRKDFIKNCCPSRSKIYHEQRMIIEDFFDNDIPQNFCAFFEKSNTIRSTNFITEFLKSVSDSVIIKQLNKIDDNIFIQKMW